MTNKHSETKLEIPIVQRENPVLRALAKPVSISEINSPKIKNIISDMKKALNSQKDGVAIAAPQIDIGLQIFVVSKKVFTLMKEKDDVNSKNDLVFINPKIIKLSKKKKLMEEGCLSVRYAYGKVYRADRATVEAYNENGDKITRGAGGILAQIFQHETDHLNGVLFTDKAEDLEEISEEKYQEIYKD